LDDFEAQLSSEGWGGDVYLVLQNETDDAIVLVMQTSWESENDAGQFFDAFRQHSTARFGSPTSSNSNSASWTHPDGITKLSLDGQFTTWILAPDEATALLVQSAFTP
jgi:hypothetical protein